MPVVRLAAPRHAADPAALARVTGPIRSLERAHLNTVGFTGARHERLALTLENDELRHLVVKRIRPSTDWTTRGSGATFGREAGLLAEPALAPVWDVFACPYVAFAAEGADVALVMEDLSEHLFPDVREPLREAQEDALLGAFAALHARFWNAPALDIPWLARPHSFAGLLDAAVAADGALPRLLPDALRDGLTRGWPLALKRLPPGCAKLMTVPAVELEWLWQGLPRTLLHGDAKVANFAVLADGRVAAFDWAMLGAGPCTLEAGWYLAVNASRLSRSKEDVLRRYRALLAVARGEDLAEDVWASLVRCGLVVGARELLWSKALALEADRPGARAEWEWWVAQLEAHAV